jgi:hypothetical protein
VADADEGRERLHTGGGSTPIPDPTLLTQQQIFREIGALRELVFTRLDAMDKAVELFKADLVRVPTDTDKQVSQLRDLHQEKLDSIRTLMDEKFHSVATQFAERDVRVEETAKSTKVAVDAALQAAEKAVEKQNEAFSLSIAKSEAATIKQIDQQAELLRTATGALDDKISDGKDRLGDLTITLRDGLDRLRQERLQELSVLRDEFRKALDAAREESRASLVALSTSQNVASGQHIGSSQTWAWVVGGVGLVVGLVTIAQRIGI